MPSLKRKGLSPKKSARELLDMYYLEARSYLLETASIMDRIERGEGGQKIMTDKRVQNLFEICQLLTTEKEHRAEKILQHLSV